MPYAESIPCGFKIIQSPDLENLRITIEPTLPDSHMDEYMMSLKLHPKTPIDDVQKLEDMLNDMVEAFWVGKISELGQ